jgi:phosphoribosyl-ATP pyrophosphohydrolase
MGDSIQRLYDAVQAARGNDPALSRTSRLFRDGIHKMAKKLAEEAVEVGLDAVQSQHDAVILESADLLYNLCVLWAACGISPSDVEGEIDRRERMYGIAEKLPKASTRGGLSPVGGAGAPSEGASQRRGRGAKV